MIASVLGDGSIMYPHSDARYPRLMWNMGNKEHAQYKHRFFEFLGSTYTEGENPGWGPRWYQVKTSCHPVLVGFHDELYVGRKKNFTQRWLNELDAFGWAWVYGDDGHLGSNDEAFIHTEGYGKEVSQMYANAINAFLGGDYARVFSYIGGTPKKDRFSVKINGRGSDEFFSRIEAHMADGMEYKIGSRNIKRRK